MALTDSDVPPIVFFSDASGSIQSRGGGVSALALVVAAPNPERIVGGQCCAIVVISGDSLPGSVMANSQREGSVVLCPVTQLSNMVAAP